MREVVGDLWTYPADVRCITTNGTVKANGECVMGRGCAKEAATRHPQLPAALGITIKLLGNRPHFFNVPGPTMHEFGKLVTFPVKHKWMETADLDLIAESARHLASMARNKPDWTFLLPRPGCGNGGLVWGKVRPVIEPILPDNVLVITWAT